MKSALKMIIPFPMHHMKSNFASQLRTLRKLTSQRYLNFDVWHLDEHTCGIKHLHANYMYSFLWTILKFWVSFIGISCNMRMNSQTNQLICVNSITLVQDIPTYSLRMRLSKFDVLHHQKYGVNTHV